MIERITRQDAQYALEVVREICTQVGPGIPGSLQERERAAIIKRELESHLGAGNVAVEEFTFAPGAFLGAQLIGTFIMSLAILLNISIGRITSILPWISGMVALAFSILAIFLFIIEFVFVFELVDPLFGKKKSVNVVGCLRKAENQDVRRLLILSGHHDSALEFTWLRFTGYGFFLLTFTWMIALITVLVMCFVQLVGAISGNANLLRIGTINWVLLIYPIMPSIIFALFYTRGKKNGGKVPGAADNLSACGLVVAMCRFLEKNPAYIPDNTEIRFITFGSEEAGVRGSRRYVERHLEELKRLDVRLLNYETIAHPVVTILASESSGTVKNSPEMVKSVVSAAERAGVPYQVKPATLGVGNDAGPFSQAGLQATTLVGFTIQQQVEFYHQEWDKPEILTIEPLVNVLKLSFEWILNRGE